MIREFISSRPWILIVAVLVAFVIWWVYFILLAVKNAPPEIPLVTRPAHAAH